MTKALALTASPCSRMIKGVAVGLLTVIFGLVITSPAAALAAPAPTNAQSLFERVRPSVVEILVKFKGNQGNSSGRSGFLTHRSDLIVTNYHVVTQPIYEPEDYALIVVTDQDEEVGAKVVAVDVLHDLAVLKLDRGLPAPLLALQEATPAKGEQGYSMGKPGAYNQSIVGGTFNGLTDRDSTPQIIFSGPINSGMSGGPTINAKGEVVGVNVASSTRDQLLGFIVPAKALGDLIRSLGAIQVPDNTSLRKGMSTQFAQYGRQQLKRMSGHPDATRTLGASIRLGHLNALRSLESKFNSRSTRGTYVV